MNHESSGQKLTAELPGCFFSFRLKPGQETSTDRADFEPRDLHTAPLCGSAEDSAFGKVHQVKGVILGKESFENGMLATLLERSWLMSTRKIRQSFTKPGLQRHNYIQLRCHLRSRNPWVFSLFKAPDPFKARRSKKSFPPNSSQLWLSCHLRKSCLICSFRSMNWEISFWSSFITGLLTGGETPQLTPGDGFSGVG